MPDGTVSAVRRCYGDLDREQVVSALYDLARRVGVQRVTMADLADELGAAKPSVYYHVPGKQAALDLLAEAVLATIAEPGLGPWDRRLCELYCAARKAMLEVPGIAVVLQTNGNGQTARRHDRLSRNLLGGSRPRRCLRIGRPLVVVHVPARLGEPRGLPPGTLRRTRPAPGRRPVRTGSRADHGRYQGNHERDRFAMTVAAMVRARADDDNVGLVFRRAVVDLARGGRRGRGAGSMAARDARSRAVHRTWACCCRPCPSMCSRFSARRWPAPASSG